MNDGEIEEAVLAPAPELELGPQPPTFCKNCSLYVGPTHSRCSRCDTPVPGRPPCMMCGGEGHVANTEGHEPWSMWESLPHDRKYMVRLGLVKRVKCPSCLGGGELYAT